MGSDVVVIERVEELIVIVKVRLAFCASAKLSVIRIVNETTSARVGTPLISPEPVSVSPAGKQDP